MAKREKKTYTCTVEVTEGFEERLVRALEDIYYARKNAALMRGEKTDDKGSSTAQAVGVGQAGGENIGKC